MQTLIRIRGWMVGGGLLAILPLMGCAQHEVHAAHEHPAQVEHIEGSDLSKVTLTERAAERIGLKTTPVTEEEGTGVRIVPYSSIIYDPHGNTWVYTAPAPRTFVRAPIVIDRIEGDNVYLAEGPPAGMAVASTGVAEIYGTEFTVGH